MLTENNSCDYDVTKRTCTFSCSQAEELKCRARYDYYVRENTFERDIHNLKKDLSAKYEKIALNKFLLAESTTLTTETEALLDPKVSLVSLKDIAFALQNALVEYKGLYRPELEDIYFCKKERIKKILKQKKNKVNNCIIASKESLIAEVEILLPQK